MIGVGIFFEKYRLQGDNFERITRAGEAQCGL
jgi:hypothetical protein